MAGMMIEMGRFLARVNNDLTQSLSLDQQLSIRKHHL
jgi:hypothetical protein